VIHERSSRREVSAHQVRRIAEKHLKKTLQLSALDHIARARSRRKHTAPQQSPSSRSAEKRSKSNSGEVIPTQTSTKRSSLSSTSTSSSSTSSSTSSTTTTTTTTSSSSSSSSAASQLTSTSSLDRSFTSEESARSGSSLDDGAEPVRLSDAATRAATTLPENLLYNGEPIDPHTFVELPAELREQILRQALTARSQAAVLAQQAHLLAEAEHRQRLQKATPIQFSDVQLQRVVQRGDSKREAYAPDSGQSAVRITQREGTLASDPSRRYLLLVHDDGESAPVGQEADFWTRSALGFAGGARAVGDPYAHTRLTTALQQSGTAASRASSALSERLSSSLVTSGRASSSASHGSTAATAITRSLVRPLAPHASAHSALLAPGGGDVMRRLMNTPVTQQACGRNPFGGAHSFSVGVTPTRRSTHDWDDAASQRSALMLVLSSSEEDDSGSEVGVDTHSAKELVRQDSLLHGHAHRQAGLAREIHEKGEVHEEGASTAQQHEEGVVGAAEEQVVQLQAERRGGFLGRPEKENLWPGAEEQRGFAEEGGFVDGADEEIAPPSALHGDYAEEFADQGIAPHQLQGGFLEGSDEEIAPPAFAEEEQFGELHAHDRHAPWAPSTIDRGTASAAASQHDTPATWSAASLGDEQDNHEGVGSSSLCASSLERSHGERFPSSWTSEAEADAPFEEDEEEEEGEKEKEEVAEEVREGVSEAERYRLPALRDEEGVRSSTTSSPSTTSLTACITTSTTTTLAPMPHGTEGAEASTSLAPSSVPAWPTSTTFSSSSAVAPEPLLLARSSVPHYVASSCEMESNPMRQPELAQLEQSDEYISSSRIRQVLLEEQRDLRLQAEKKDRQTMSISDMEVGLCTEMMELFDVPFIFSPFDAEVCERARLCSSSCAKRTCCPAALCVCVCVCVCACQYSPPECIVRFLPFRVATLGTVRSTGAGECGGRGVQRGCGYAAVWCSGGASCDVQEAGARVLLPRHRGLLHEAHT
jgi:hypothetical protein